MSVYFSTVISTRTKLTTKSTTKPRPDAHLERFPIEVKQMIFKALLNLPHTITLTPAKYSQSNDQASAERQIKLCEDYYDHCSSCDVLSMTGGILSPLQMTSKHLHAEIRTWYSACMPHLWEAESIYHFEHRPNIIVNVLRTSWVIDCGGHEPKVLQATRSPGEIAFRDFKWCRLFEARRSEYVVEHLMEFWRRSRHLDPLITKMLTRYFHLPSELVEFIISQAGMVEPRNRNDWW